MAAGATTSGAFTDCDSELDNIFMVALTFPLTVPSCAVPTILLTSGAGAVITDIFYIKKTNVRN